MLSLSRNGWQIARNSITRNSADAGAAADDGLIKRRSESGEMNSVRPPFEALCVREGRMRGNIMDWRTTEKTRSRGTPEIATIVHRDLVRLLGWMLDGKTRKTKRSNNHICGEVLSLIRLEIWLAACR